MEFSYKLSESEYLQALKVAVKSRGIALRLLISYAWFAVLFLVIWGAFLVEVWIVSPEQQTATAPYNQPPSFLFLTIGSILPALIYSMVVLIVVSLTFQWIRRGRGLKYYRTDPACQAETTCTVTPRSVAFHSATGSAESIWGCYKSWHERNGFLILTTRAGARKIVKISGLAESAKAELRALLTAALPNKY